MTTNVTILTPITHTRAVSGSCVGTSYSATFISPSIFYAFRRHTPSFTRASEVHGVRSLQEEAVLAVSPADKSTPVGFVRLFTGVMDGDEAALMV